MTVEFSIEGRPAATRPSPVGFRRMRRLANVTIYELAAAAGWSAPRVSILERLQKTCRPETYARYLRALAVCQANKKGAR